VKELLYRALDYCKLYPCAGDEPYINQLSFQIQQLELSELGFVASQSETPTEVRLDTQSAINTYIDLIIFKADKTNGQSEAQPSAQRSAPLTTNPEGVARSMAEAASDETRSEMITPAPILDEPARDGMKKEDDSSWTPKEKNKFIGFGFEHSPGQNVRWFGIYQQSKLGFLSGDDSLSIKVGAQESALASLNYFADYVLFDHLKKRLTLQVTGNSDFTANRLFSGVATDERRTGGLVRGELELFRNYNGAQLRLFAEGRRATVTLSRSGSDLSKVNLTSLEMGGIFLAETRAAYRPKQLKLDFRIRLGLPDNEANYAVYSLTGNYHQLLSRFFEADLSGRLEFATESTLIFDQPSFGGAEVVRGFRHDDLIGRRLWSLQPELWFAVPGVAGSENGISKLLERHVRLAGFSDVGGIYRTGTGKDGVKFGPGVGARLIFFPIIMKLDWAYGIGETANGRGHGRFYFSVGTNLPF
jgi:hypothetical protein